MDISASLPFSKAFDFASGAIARRFQNPFWKITEAMWGAQLRSSLAEVKRFSRTIVSSAICRREKTARVSTKEPTATVETMRDNLIDALLNHIEDHQVVADAAMNYLSAGSHRHPVSSEKEESLRNPRQRHNSTIHDLDFIPALASSRLRRKSTRRVEASFYQEWPASALVV